MPSIREALAQAVALHQAGQLPRAEQIYRQVLQADPRNADAWHLLGVMHSQVNRHEVAVEHIRRAIEISPGQAVFYGNLGAAYRRLNRPGEAIASLHRALELDPNYAEAHNNLGVVLQNRREWAAAESCFRRALKLNPQYADAHCNLGIALLALERPAEALACQQAAARLKPNFAEAHHGIAAALAALDRPDEAIAAYRRALVLDENSPETHNDLGVALKKQNRLNEAVASFRRALAIKPDYAEAHTNLGNALCEQGTLDEAIACHLRALERKPDFVEALCNLGRALMKRGQLPQAIDCYRRAEALAPQRADAPHSLAVALMAQGELEQAVAGYRRALDRDPEFADAHNGLGVALQGQGRSAEAIVCYQRALRLKPNMHEAHNNLGNLLRDDGQITAAMDCYHRALQLKPEMHEAHNNLGNACKDQGRLDEAVACYRRALEIKPDFADAHSNLLFALQYRPGVSLAELAAAHAEFDRQQVGPACRAGQEAPAESEDVKFAASSTSYSPFRQKGPTPVRVGFVSPDLCQHPVGFFSIRTLENLDRGKAEIYCYSDRLGKDTITARFQAVAATWRDVFGWSDERLAAQIRNDRIDVLFDLAGHTARNRMLTFARKPAPVQATWIGYVGTTGLRAMDYLLADRYVVPEEAERYYTEKVLRLPECYVCYDPPDDAPPVGPLPAARRGHVTFGSCNNPAKLNEPVFAAWAEILRRVEGSRLFLKYRGLTDPGFRVRCADHFAAQGISTERLIIEDWSAKAKLLAAHNRVDIALDPFPFSGGLTTCNALWMGLPVVTWPDETFASRHSLSFLSNIGATETIARTREDYIAIAAGLAADLPRLAALRESLRPRMACSPLCDGKRFARYWLDLVAKIART
jgi:protein O-GlcNAc transferase